ncbi:MAG: hypothetical protein KJN93_08845 [Alphaproteobacteria bacterium]|nr:hypothetical protein [Alphaproteobacteria bacterium]
MLENQTALRRAPVLNGGLCAQDSRIFRRRAFKAARRFGGKMDRSTDQLRKVAFFLLVVLYVYVISLGVS